MLTSKSLVFYLTFTSMSPNLGPPHPQEVPSGPVRLTGLFISKSAVRGRGWWTATQSPKGYGHVWSHLQLCFQHLLLLCSVTQLKAPSSASLTQVLGPEQAVDSALFTLPWPLAGQGDWGLCSWLRSATNGDSALGSSLPAASCCLCCGQSTPSHMFCWNVAWRAKFFWLLAGMGHNWKLKLCI